MNLSKAKILKGYNFLLGLAVISEIAVLLYFFLPVALNTPVFLVKISSGSMMPEYQAGDLVVVSGIGKERIDSLVGEPIAFFDPVRGRIIVHRAIAERGQCLLTQGDANDVTDFFEPCQKQILGRVIKKIF